MKKQLSLFVAAAVIISVQWPGSFATEPTAPYGDEASTIISKMEQLAPRIAGSAAETKTAQYIQSQMTQMGLKPVTSPFSATIPNGSGNKTKTIKSANVSATIPGTSSKQIIIGAHYDSVNQGKGADDNASGVAVMLETADRIVHSKSKPYYTLVFVAFGSEEVGLLGSKAYVKQMSTTAKKNTVVMVNLDSLIVGDVMNVYGTQGVKGFYRDLALQFAKDNQLSVTTNQGNNPEYPYGTTIDASDHAAFKNIGIQYVYFESTNWDLGAKDGYTQVDLQYGVDGEIWHTSYDTVSYISKTFPNRIQEHLTTFSKLLEYLLTYKPN